MEYTIKINVPDTMTADDLKHMGVLCILADARTAARLVEVAAPQLKAYSEYQVARLETAQALGHFDSEGDRASFAMLHDKADEADHNAHFIMKALSEATFHLLHPEGLTEAEEEARNKAAFEDWQSELRQQLAKAKGGA